MDIEKAKKLFKKANEESKYVPYDVLFDPALDDTNTPIDPELREAEFTEDGRLVIKED